MDNNLEEQLGAILSNPEMMQKIQAMAQSLSQPEQESQKSQEIPKMPDIDLSMLQKLSGLAGQTGIDQNQKTLLSALSPYLSRNKVAKLENAMRAAKMARLASGFLNGGGTRQLTGR